MTDLHDLKVRVDAEGLCLSPSEAREVLAELEASRKLIDLPLDGHVRWEMRAQRDMVTRLLMNLGAEVATEAEAGLVAGVVIQELAGLARTQVKAERC